MATTEKARAHCKEKRRIAKEEGLCGLCYKRDAMPGQTRCGACAERQDDYKALRRVRAAGAPREEL